MSPNKRRKPRTATHDLDPVTFEILRNSFANAVELMAQQFRLTCHSFVIYYKDFSCSLADAGGNTIVQGDDDIAVHIGTHHLVCKEVLASFDGDVHPGDVFITNDPYSGGTHFNDVRVLRPIFADDELIAWAMANGHWSDVGGSVPGSFDVMAREHFGEGLRITPVKIFDRGEFRRDIGRFIVGNTRVPEDNLSDLLAQVEATRVCEREIQRLVGRYGTQDVVAAFQRTIDNVSTLVRNRIASLPNGEWTAIDYLDGDPQQPEGLIPISVTMRIEDDRLSFDLSNSAPEVSTFMNSTFGATLSGVLAGIKHFLPDIPVNAGFIDAVNVELGKTGSVVNATWPTAVSGFVSGTFEKIINAIFELWSHIQPERAMACSFNLEYLLVGGRDMREESRPVFMWYDWMVGGWGARQGADGATAASPLFGAGFAAQPIEGQERLNPVVTTHYRIVTDSGGPGKYRGGCGVSKAVRLADSEATVMSYCCDRARSIPWGIRGGLGSTPQGLWLNPDTPEQEYLGATFSNVSLLSGDVFSRPSAGGGGLGDPLDRSPELVLEDVRDGYVSRERAASDYGVVIDATANNPQDWFIQDSPTGELREHIRGNRMALLEEDAEVIARRFRSGEINDLDCIRQYGVILNWGTGELLPRTTQQTRQWMRERALGWWRSSEATKESV